MGGMAARYDAVVETYTGGPDDVTTPAASALLELTGDVAGRRVLDLACGHGVIARELARRGAHVVGIDLSSGLVERARAIESDAPLGIRYAIADAADGTALDGEQFDVATCNFGLSDIDDLDGALATVARLLAPEGRFVFSILHPCFAGDDLASGAWPADGTYYDERWWLATGERSYLRREVGANHRMVSTYVNALVRHGLAIDAMVEPKPEASWTADRPQSAAQPVYLAVRCRREPIRTSGVPSPP
jgi:2-polyprenyl-3-methyl-5-hydroxy-6-metoxy-1,4-benzoquinol methylase